MIQEKTTMMLTKEKADITPSSFMGDEKGIYFTFRSDMGVISSIVPEPLETAFPLVSGYIVNIDKPGFSEPYREAMLGVYVKFRDKIGMYPVSFLLSGPGAEMATYLGREKSGLSKKMCEQKDCIRVIREGDVLRGMVERKGVLLMDVSLKLGEYNNPGTGAIYNDPEPGKVTGGMSYYFQTSLLPDENGISHFVKVNMLENEAEYTYRKWEPGKVTVRLQSGKDDAWGMFPVFENMGGAYSENDLLMKEQFVAANPNPENVMEKLLVNRFDKLALL